MLTSSLITLLKKEFPDWSRVLLLELINEIQRMIFTQNATRQMWMYDSSTGTDPVLSTIAGTHCYDIDTINGFNNNAWRVYAVYKTSINEPEIVEKLDATPSNSAKVIFPIDPGTTNYYIRAYRFCTLLTSESIQLEVPHSYHLSHVYEGVCGLIEKYRSGVSKRLDDFKNILLPCLIKSLSDSNGGIYNVKYKGF